MTISRSAVVFSIAASLALTSVAGAAETKPSAEARTAVQQVAAAAKIAAQAPIPLSAIFAQVSDDLDLLTGPHGFVVTKVVKPEVVVARIEADGTRTTACVDSERAARAFFDGADRPAKAPKE